MIVKVTQKDIDGGFSKEGMYCPIALAFKRASGMRTVNVTTECIFVGSAWAKKPIIYSVPREAASFIRRFDNSGRNIKPFIFRSKRLR